MPFSLPDLPYPQEALEPHISRRTLSFHYEKHHQAYLKNLNAHLDGSELEEKTLEEIILISFRQKTYLNIFNNAAQVWNHTFYWNSMKPEGGTNTLTQAMVDHIARDFGSYESFKTTFQQTGLSQFGSGWVWLISEGNTLKVTSTSNAENPLIRGQRALLTCDVWEHAYYLDYQNRRSNYLDTFLTYLINWDFAEKNMVVS